MLKPIEALTRTKLDRLATRSGEGRSCQSFCFEAKPDQENCIFVLIRLYDKDEEGNQVLLTITVELPKY